MTRMTTTPRLPHRLAAASAVRALVPAAQAFTLPAANRSNPTVVGTILSTA